MQTSEKPKHKHKHRHRYKPNYKKQLKYPLLFVFLSLLVFSGIAFSKGVFKFEQKPKHRNSRVEGNLPFNYNLDKNNILSDILPSYTETASKSNLGLLERELMALNGKNWFEQMARNAFYIQTARDYRNLGFLDFEKYLLEYVASNKTGANANTQNTFNDLELEAFLRSLNRGFGSEDHPQYMIGAALEYPRSGNGGGGSGLPGGSSGSGGSGGGSGYSNPPQKPQQDNGDNVPVPEPSTIVLTAAGLLFLFRRFH